MADSLRKLAAQLARVTSDVESLKRWASTPQLPASSLDDASVPEKDAAGNIVSRWGRQEDGTHGVVIFDGPTPPVPAGLEAEDGAGVVTAVWGGTYAGDVGKLDFHAVEIYVAPEPFQYIEEATLVGAIPDPDGGRVTFGRAPGTWHIGAVTLSQAGKRSPVSALVTAKATRVADSADLERLEGAFTTSTEPPTAADGQGKPEDAYWTQIGPDGEQVARWRWNGHQWVPAPLGVQFIPEAYVDYLAANAAFVGDLFGRNISVSGEITAYSENYSTTVSQAGVQMYSNNALDRTLQYTLDDLDVGWPGDVLTGMTLVGDWAYFFQQNKVVAKNSDGVTQWIHEGPPGATYRGITGTAQGVTLLRWEHLGNGVFDHHLETLDPTTGQPTTTYQPLILLTGSREGPPVAIAADPDNPSRVVVQWYYYGREQWLEWWDLTSGTRTGEFGHQRTTEGQGRGLTVHNGNVFLASGFIAEEGNYYTQYNALTGEVVRQVILPAPALDLGAGNGLIWASLAALNLVMAFSTTTGQMEVVARRTQDDDDARDNLIQAFPHDGTLFGLDFRQGQHFEVATYEVVEDRHLRVNIDNFQGKMTSEELEVRGWQVTPSTKHYIRGPDIFASLEPGISVASSSLAVIDEAEDGATVTMSVTIYGIDRSAGNQRIEIGTLHPDLAPGLAVALPGYYTNGAATAAITGAGSVSLRWSSGSAANQVFFATSYAIDRGD